MEIRYNKVNLFNGGPDVNYDFIRVASATPNIKVADTQNNASEICKMIDEAVEKKTKLLVFPELCVTGYTCSDLFWQTQLLDDAKIQTQKIAEYAKNQDMIIIVGLPYEHEMKLYNVAAVLYRGEILGLITKKNIPNYSEFYEARHFTQGFEKVQYTDFMGKKVPIGMNILFQCNEMRDFVLAVEICEDLWVPNPPSINHALAGASVIANLSASDEVTGKASYRRDLVAGQSGRLLCAYIYSDAGEGESSTDFVYSGQNMIAENGNVLAEAARFHNAVIYADVDLERIKNKRRIMSTYMCTNNSDYLRIAFDMNFKKTQLERFVDPMPFVPKNAEKRDERCNEILELQSLGLKKRIAHTNAESVVVGISGGLDSTLALLVIVRAFDMLNKDRKNIIAVTMPGFGTTDRTYDNAVTMVKSLGATLLEINIAEAATSHFKAIGHDQNIHDVTYENVQARQRTLYLMNLANQYRGFVVGTGDLSELALGWATYNGDHMSMYGVNASIPKTLVRHLVKYYADTCKDTKLENVLLDVLDTPVSPELLPPQQNGEIAQKTEDLVGPYELHDFFMYYMLRMGFTPKKIYYLAQNAFEGNYDNETILKWLKTFYRRFFSQQFKRSCLPDGPKVGTVAVSPRGDLRMPSDACATGWLKELDHIDL